MPSPLQPTSSSQERRATDRQTATSSRPNTAPTVELTLSVAGGHGKVSASLRVRGQARHLSKSTLALQRHTQRLIDARRASDAAGSKPLPKVQRQQTMILPSSVADLQPEFGGEQLLFVHFIPPSLRKLGKEKVPWIVHTTGAPVICREALHVHFRGVRNFETHEGVATGARCQCMIAQHHLRGFGCLRWEDGVAIIESPEVAARESTASQTEASTTAVMQTQTEVAKACCSEVQTDESAVTSAEREAVLCAQNASISAQLKKAAEYTETVEAALREAQRSAEARECSFESEAESLRARIAELEAAVQSYQSQQQQKKTADALERMAVGDGSGYGTDRAMLVKLVSKRLLKAEATIGELRTRVAWTE